MACGGGRTPGPAAGLFDLQGFSGPVGGELHVCVCSQGTKASRGLPGKEVREGRESGLQRGIWGVGTGQEGPAASWS